MKNKGFSFVELIVAVAILGIVSLPIASSFVLAARVEAKAAILTKINDAADDVMLLVTEMENMENYGQTVTVELEEVTYDADYILQNVYKPSLPLSVSPVERDDAVLEYAIVYNGYNVRLTLTPCVNEQGDSLGFYRIDLTIDHEANGSTYHVTRKGVLSYAAS